MNTVVRIQDGRNGGKRLRCVFWEGKRVIQWLGWGNDSFRPFPRHLLEYCAEMNESFSWTDLKESTHWWIIIQKRMYRNWIPRFFRSPPNIQPAIINTHHHPQHVFLAGLWNLHASQAEIVIRTCRFRVWYEIMHFISPWREENHACVWLTENTDFISPCFQTSLMFDKR